MDKSGRHHRLSDERSLPNKIRNLAAASRYVALRWQALTGRLGKCKRKRLPIRSSSKQVSLIIQETGETATKAQRSTQGEEVNRRAGHIFIYATKTKQKQTTERPEETHAAYKIVSHSVKTTFPRFNCALVHEQLYFFI